MYLELNLTEFPPHVYYMVSGSGGGGDFYSLNKKVKCFHLSSIGFYFVTVCYDNPGGFC